MAKRTGYADLPLHVGTVPKWLADRMMQLGTLIIESLIQNYGKKEVLIRLSDPLWFQSFGAVLGMDWHSSGITTSVMYALKRGLNPRAKELGICICGGRGRYSRKTPEELMYLSDATGLDGSSLVRASRLCAKVDNTAVQDGFQLYQHNFILTDEGDWAVVQQGMNAASRTARRYHWCSSNLHSFVEEPHTGIVGENRGTILNLTDKQARPVRNIIVDIAHENPDRIIHEVSRMTAPAASIVVPAVAPIPLQGELIPTGNTVSAPPFPARTYGESVDPAPSRNCAMPAHHDVRAEDVDLKRLGAVLTTAYESQPGDFESLLLTPGLGPRTLQSLALVSEVVYGTPSRFTDPARYSFAHGGKDGHPFPVPCRIYDETIRVLGDSIEQSKLGDTDKSDCLNRLYKTTQQIEQNCSPEADFDKTMQHEWAHSHEWGGRTVSGEA
jgi:uncharacterized protein